MTRYIGTLTADGNITFPIFNIRGKSRQTYDIWATGSSFSGTVAISASPDGGTTYVALKDLFGNAISFTSNGLSGFELMSDPKNPVIVKAALTGSSSPNITISLFDNR